MWIADNWTDYEVIDCSQGEKLERWGNFLLVRPDPQVIWDTPKGNPGWVKPDGHYHRSKKGGGSWENFRMPDEWAIGYRNLTFRLKPFSFKHTGLFPEQAVNWDWFSEKIRARVREKGNSAAAAGSLPAAPGGNPDTLRGAADRSPSRVDSAKSSSVSGRSLQSAPVRVLNLFAYTGGATLAAARAGAAVTHVDASKGMVAWAKENALASGLGDAPIRYLVDDCVKFVQREIRRGNTYDAVIMDPPSYGRGPKGEIWKIEDMIHPLIRLCAQLLSDEPLFFLVNSYTTGLAPAVLTYLLSTELNGRDGTVCSDEIGLPVTESGLVLPCGASGRWQAVN